MKHSPKLIGRLFNTHWLRADFDRRIEGERPTYGVINV